MYGIRTFSRDFPSLYSQGFSLSCCTKISLISLGELPNIPLHLYNSNNDNMQPLLPYLRSEILLAL